MYEGLQHIVGTAIVDSRFRQQLLAESSVVLKGFDLTREEREAIDGIRANTMQGFAQQLHGWIRKNAAQGNATVSLSRAPLE